MKMNCSSGETWPNHVAQYTWFSHVFPLLSFTFISVVRVWSAAGCQSSFVGWLQCPWWVRIEAADRKNQRWTKKHGLHIYLLSKELLLKLTTGARGEKSGLIRNGFLKIDSKYRRHGLTAIRLLSNSGDLKPIETAWGRLRRDFALREF